MRTLAVVVAAVVVCGPALAADTVRRGTQVTLRMKQTISSGKTPEGTTVYLELVGHLKGADGQVVALAGSSAVGTVTRSDRSRAWGKPGKLTFTVESLRVADGTDVQLAANNAKRGGGRVLGAALNTYLFGIVGGALSRGKNITVRAGQQVQAIITEDYTLKSVEDLGGAVPAEAPVATLPTRRTATRREAALRPAPVKTAPAPMKADAPVGDALPGGVAEEAPEVTIPAAPAPVEPEKAPEKEPAAEVKVEVGKRYRFTLTGGGAVTGTVKEETAGQVVITVKSGSERRLRRADIRAAEGVE